MYLSISNIDWFSLQKDKNYYPQMFLEECKHVVKEKMMPEFITDEIENFSDDSDRDDSDEENQIQKFFLKKCQKLFNLWARKFRFQNYKNFFVFGNFQVSS